MIKATISNTTKRNAFAKLGAKKIVRGNCVLKTNLRGLTLDNYKIIGSGKCTVQNNKNQILDNVIAFSKPKEVA